MKKNWQNHKGMIKMTLLFLVIMWTGILLSGLRKQYDMLGGLEEKCSDYLVKLGFSKITLGQEQKEATMFLNQSSALLYYFQQEQGGNTIKVFQENQLLGEKEKEANASDNPEALPEHITVFDNGSSDITENNQSAKKQTISTDQNAVEVSSSKTTEKNIPKELEANAKLIQTLRSEKNRSFLLQKFYIVDSSTSIDKKVFQVDKLLEKKVALEKKKEPQILIYHTHGASEAFIDSKAGRKSESIIGVGTTLASILSEQYGYHVIHDETEYDKVNGKIDRNKAYNQSYQGVSKTLQKYPSIQVVIDLHRDGVGNKVHRLTTIDGKKTAQVMFFNGLSRNRNGNISYLHNDNLQGNLAFSLQMKLACMENYSDFAKPIYLKNYRYNLHLRERSLLIELGNENNTLQEAKNAMSPLAKVLHQVLSGE